jgi:hypothetical protein
MNLLASSLEIGPYVIVTWTQDVSPYATTRDPLEGPAQEIRNVEDGSKQEIYMWNDQFLGLGDEPFDLVLERYAKLFPNDFAASVDRWEKRMRVWRETDGSRFETEAERMAKAASRMSPVYGEWIKQYLERLWSDRDVDTTLRL